MCGAENMLSAPQGVLHKNRLLLAEPDPHFASGTVIPYTIGNGCDLDGLGYRWFVVAVEGMLIPITSVDHLGRTTQHSDAAQQIGV